jgi:hypothetical protein
VIPDADAEGRRSGGQEPLYSLEEVITAVVKLHPVSVELLDRGFERAGVGQHVCSEREF